MAALQPAPLRDDAAHGPDEGRAAGRPRELDGVGRILGYPDRSAYAVEEEYLAVTRRARKVFEKLFYG